VAEGGFAGPRPHAQSARIVRLPRRPSRVRRTHSHAVCAAVSAQPLPARVSEWPLLLGWKPWESSNMIFGRACGSGEWPCNSSHRTISKSRTVYCLVPAASGCSGCKRVR